MSKLLEPVAYDMYMRSSVERSKVCTEALFTFFLLLRLSKVFIKETQTFRKCLYKFSSHHSGPVRLLTLRFKEVGGGFIPAGQACHTIRLLQATQTTYKSLPHILWRRIMHISWNSLAQHAQPSSAFPSLDMTDKKYGTEAECHWHLTCSLPKFKVNASLSVSIQVTT